MYKSFFSFPRDQCDPSHLLDQSAQSDMDYNLEMFTRELFTEDDTCNNNVTNTLAEESHTLNTPPLVKLSDEPEPPHPVVELSDDPEPSDQVVVLTDDQELPAAPSTPTAPTPPSTTPPEPKIKVVCEFNTVDIRQKVAPSTMKDYDVTQKHKAAKAKAHGQAHQIALPTVKKVSFSSPAPSTSSTSSRASSTSSTERNLSLVAHLPLPTPDFPPDPYANSPHFKQPIPPSKNTGVRARLGQKQHNNVKARLGHTSAQVRLTPKATPPQGQPLRPATPPAPPAPAPVPAPSPSHSAPAPGWTGDPSPSGNINCNRV